MSDSKYTDMERCQKYIAMCKTQVTEQFEQYGTTCVQY